MSLNYRMQICQGMDDIAQADWNSLVRQAHGGVLHPALRHEYLLAMERSGAATAETGWGPVHLAILDSNDTLAAALPLYLKSHSYGEYVFDWAWAQAYQREGLPYYPKLLCALPFTPVPANKLLHRDAESLAALVAGLNTACQRWSLSDADLGTTVSSAHLLFLNEAEHTALTLNRDTPGWMQRRVIQFHWRNEHPLEHRPYRDFEEFLGCLNQKKRKNIRSERRKALEGGLTVQARVGHELSSTELDFILECYNNTYFEHGSTPYLNRDFFNRLMSSMGEQVLVFLALDDGQPVGCAMFLFNEERLYGRYWGATRRQPCLHFELCYYQAIEWAIQRGISVFEGGAQGEHKIWRGLNPVSLSSAHWVADDRFAAAIGHFLKRETHHLQQLEGELGEHLAFKAAQGDAQPL